jgi:ABC-type multidrug transport system fused ATPase/permease subunit
MASAERIFEILDTDPEPSGRHTAPQQVAGRVEFDRVWFAYAGQDWVLRDVSFALRPGQSLALVGATGAGKSTVVSLLCRFYEAQRGAVRVDGVDVREWEVRDLRRRIGLVHQDVFLFAGSVADNIALGRSGLEETAVASHAASARQRITRERVERAARDANADRFVRRLPAGYDQPVGERGVSLSAGQRQLLSFARVLAADPEILVLDEATANVDTETEMWIQEAVGRLLRGRTSLVIAHRLSTVRHADAILVLHRGQVRELGTHEQLLARQGIYYRLHQLQYGAAEPGLGAARTATAAGRAS